MKMRMLTISAAALIAGSMAASAQINNVYVGNTNINDDWECIATVGGTTYIGTDNTQRGAKRELRRAGIPRPYFCSHDDG